MRCQDEIRAAEPPMPAVKERDNEGPQGHGGSELRARLLYDIGADCADHALQLRIDFKRLPARVNDYFSAQKLGYIKNVVIRLDEEQLAELLDLLEGRFAELAEQERES